MYTDATHSDLHNSQSFCPFLFTVCIQLPACDVDALWFVWTCAHISDWQNYVSSTPISLFTRLNIVPQTSTFTGMSHIYVALQLFLWFVCDRACSWWGLYTLDSQKQPLIGNGCVARNSGVTVESGEFCAVCTDRHPLMVMCGNPPYEGGTEYLHRSPASRKRRQKGNPVWNQTVRYGLKFCGT
jgi:hypothetical protein